MELARRLGIEILGILLRPAIRFCIRNSLYVQDVIEVVKKVFVEVGEAEIVKTSRKINASRLSVLTGLHRAEIKRLQASPVLPGEESGSLTARVIGMWRHDPRFASRSGKPRVLSYKGDGTDFAKLVRAISKNIHPGTVLFELLRRGLVEETGQGIKLTFAIAPVIGDEKAVWTLLAREHETLQLALEENIFRQVKTSNLHIRTEYDNISQKALPEIREWLIVEGKEFHKRARAYLSQFDRDIFPQQPEEHGAGGAKVVVSAFSWTSPVPDWSKQ